MPRGRRSRATRSSPTTGPSKHDQVTITNVDLLQHDNQVTSNTDAFSSPKHVVLRRGVQFDLIIGFSSMANLDTKSVKVHLQRGYRARYTRGTKFEATCSKRPRQYYQWEMTVVSTGTNEARYGVTVPVDAPVGSYSVYVVLPGSRQSNDIVWEPSKEIVILFNPWHPSDGVYMADAKHREEYVNNEMGLIWAGTYNDTFTWPWNFAQFESVTLEALLHMMDFFGLDSDARRNPILVSKCLTEMVNVNDSDGGILVGLWSANDEDYADGVEPTSWSGSRAIMQQYVRSKQPVKYAQCWVFGGTLTSVLRCVGIPTRPITNFASAHDADFNRAIDYYYDRNNKMVDDMSNDSIWNYHVWVEAWMQRPDLHEKKPGHYGGWQALDATPQELSPHTRTMVVGPASLQAIKDGEGDDMEYDNEFVIAEVNADIKYHFMTRDGTYKMMDSDTRAVGKNISTKAVGSDDQEIITNNYKYKEGTVAERAALTGDKGEDPTNLFSCDVNLVSGGRVGNDVVFNVNVKAKSGTIKAVFETVMYTGVVGKEIKKTVQSTSGGSISSGKPQTLSFTLSGKDYVDKLGDQATLLATFLAYLSEPEQCWISKFPVQLHPPELTLKIAGKVGKVSVRSGQHVQAEAKFVNPLKKILTNVKYYIEGTGIEPQTIPAKDVPSGGTSTLKIPFTAQRYSNPEKNRMSLIVTAQSKQLKAIMGRATIIVQ